MYIADCYNNVIRRVNATTEQVETYAGAGTSEHIDGRASRASFACPSAVAYSDRWKSLCVTDTLNGVLRVVREMRPEDTSKSASTAAAEKKKSKRLRR
eukprot:CAMPEP_0197536156 /NCGR_PEP_ID=MMETSP1318-20131121/53105_1 /TAXON_ID=552666 /ORGANISM="Partenskyella glossopodia, Strain RCC365" /LENGTH=97 /DNA_ID=CAMNT_0043093963 /DNA_START=63 /DNA_END=356 /DNA_ORIENTATION=+